MEQAKLKESKRFLEEDQKKFLKLIEDSKQAAKDAEDQVKQKQFDKNQLIKSLEKLNQEK